MKRPAAAFVEPVAKKPSLLSDVIGSLDPSISYNAMLAKMAEHTVGRYKDTRHPWQAEAVDWIGQELAAKVDAIQSNIDKGKAKVTDYETERARRKLAVEEAEAAREKLRANVVQAKDKLKVAEQIREGAIAELKSKKAELKRLEQAAVVHRKKSAALEEVKAVIEQLGTNVLSKSETAKVLKLGKQLGLDGSLIASLGMALSKDPSARTDFDNVIMEQFRVAYATEAEAIQGSVDIGELAVADCSEAVEEAQKAFASAEESKRISSEEVVAVEKELLSGNEAIKLATAQVKSFLPELKADADAYDEAVKALRIFVGGPLAAFNELKHKETPPAVLEEPAAPLEHVSPIEGDALNA
eukprot:TRINITY_DN62890_c0_g1_i1.p1 TRINITY_DN62890_c0_g1~~TRINITY_DN62890_c0_g1_i1.p1  ORF type:complete len:356 (-),score=93.98 TRINITY_DN62890_c0_g1_i1:200-1267(-)